MLLGKIVRSNNHIDYICQVYVLPEIPHPSEPADYGFGTFVRVELTVQLTTWLVGLVYDTVLLNPDFGNLGPRLSPQAELAVFSPDYLQEKATLVGITAIGMLDEAGTVTQGVPSLAALTDTAVEKLDDDQIRAFHRGSPTPQLTYLPLLLGQGSPLVTHLLRRVTEQMKRLFPNQAQSLAVLGRELIWQSQVSPLGGAH